jgi:hypothetical protein
MSDEKEGELAIGTGQQPEQSQPAALGQQDHVPPPVTNPKPGFRGDEGDGWRTSQFQR